MGLKNEHKLTSFQKPQQRRKPLENLQVQTDHSYITKHFVVFDFHIVLMSWESPQTTRILKFFHSIKQYETITLL